MPRRRGYSILAMPDWSNGDIYGVGMEAVKQFFEACLNPIKLNVLEFRQIVRNCQSQIACHQRRAIANSDAALKAVAHITSRRSQIVDISYDAAGLFDKWAAILGNLGTARRAFKQLDAEAILELQDFPAQGNLLHIESCSRA